MTEEEWLACTNPRTMLAFLHSRGQTGRRKLGLLFAACCSQIRHPPVEWAGSMDHADEPRDPIALTQADFHLFSAIDEALRCIRRPERSVLAPVFRDIIGPLPFRLVAIEPAWLAWNGETVVNLAQGIVEEERFERFPVLADALEDAGCTNQDVLSHSRHPGEHSRGCWLLGHLLGLT